MRRFGTAVLVLTGDKVAVHAEMGGKDVTKGGSGFEIRVSGQQLGFGMLRGNRNAQLIDLGICHAGHGAPFNQRRSVGVHGVNQAQSTMAN